MKYKNYLKKIIFEKWFLKLLSLIMAVLLWLFIVGSEVNQHIYNVPVKFTNLHAENILINGSRTNTIKVTIKGDNVTAMNRNLDEFNIIKDLSNYTPGIHDIRIYHQDIIYPKGVELVSYEPRIVTIEIDNKDIKIVDLEIPVIKGTPALGYEIKNIELSKEKTRIEGPESVLDTISELKLNEIDITGINETITKEVKIISPLNVILLDLESVKVTVYIERE